MDARDQRVRLHVSAPVDEWLSLIGVAIEHILRCRVPTPLPIGDTSALIDFLTFTQGHARFERVRVLFFDRARRLLGDEQIAEGEVDSVPLSIRNILDRALSLNAAAMVLVHNHPSGDPTPSRADIDVTRRLARTSGACGVDLIDHIILGKGAACSLRSMGLL